jgi:hypothetical protein
MGYIKTCFKFLIESLNNDRAVVLVNTSEYLKRLPGSNKIDGVCLAYVGIDEQIN